MNNKLRDAVITLYGEYVTLLEKEVAAGLPVTPADVEKGKDLIKKISVAKQAIIDAKV